MEKEYLKLLSKIMVTDTENILNKYEELYTKISELKESIYPFVTNSLNQLESILNCIETLYLIPELQNKKCISITFDTPNDIFYEFSKLFPHKLQNKSKKITTKSYNFSSIFELLSLKSDRPDYNKIPFIILNGESDSIEVLNYANLRVNLTLDEYEFLIVESKNRNISLDKLVKFFIVKFKGIDENICYISDNLCGDASKILKRIVGESVLYVSESNVDYIDKFKNIILSKKSKKYDKYSDKIINKKDINDNAKAILYGLKEEFEYIKVNTLLYYDKNIEKENKNINDITGDVVRQGNKNNKTLNNFRKSKEQIISVLKEEKEYFEIKLNEIEKILLDICADIKEDCIENKYISQEIYENIFKTIFEYGDKNINDLIKLNFKLKQYKYPNVELVSKYIQRLQKKDIEVNQNIIEYDWEKVKMLIEMDSYNFNNLPEYFKILSDHISTSKEYYLRGKITDSKEDLYKSFEMGCTEAGNILFEKNPCLNDMYVLAYGLNVCACRYIAKMELNGIKKENNTIVDENIYFFKILASLGDYEAIEEIIIYLNKVILSNIKSKILNVKLDTYIEKIIQKNSKIICELCSYLRNKRYSNPKLNEIYGINLFIKGYFSEAKEILSKINTSLAYFCIGLMYECGLGIAQDLKEARTYYNYVNENEFKEIINIKRKLNDKISEENKKREYDSNRTYGSSYSCVDSYEESSCFAPDTNILLSDGSYKQVSNLHIGDKVMVYNHYKGCLGVEKIVANIHEDLPSQMQTILKLKFSNGKILKIVKSHILYCTTFNKYVLIDESNFETFKGCKFYYYDKQIKEAVVLEEITILREITKIYAPISKKHLNLFAEGILTMPPTKLTEGLFDLDEDMKYDMSIVEKIGITPYDKVKELITEQEYEDLPCEYLEAVLYKNKCNKEDFIEILKLYRE